MRHAYWPLSGRNSTYPAVQISRATSDRTRRSRSFLAAEAISAYVERELSIIEKVERGRADVRAGRTTPHDEVMREARTIIEAARTRQ
jgi:predicted transcriptional regulator